MGRKQLHPRNGNSVRICMSKEKDKDILQAVKSGYSLTLIAYYACYAHAGLFPKLVLRDVDTQDEDLTRARAGLLFTPQTVGRQVYEELKDLPSAEISNKIKEYIRENIYIEAKASKSGLTAGMIGGEW